MNPNTIELLKTIAAVVAAGAAVLGATYTVITWPLLRLAKSQASVFETQLKEAGTQFQSQLKTEIVGLETRLIERMTAMENRLNDRIDAKLARR